MLVGTTGAILFFLLLGYNFKLDNSSPRKQIASSVNFDWTVAFVNDLNSLQVFCCTSGYLAARAIGCSEISVTEYTLNNSHKHVAHLKSASGLSCHCTCDTASSCRCPWRQMRQSNEVAVWKAIHGTCKANMSAWLISIDLELPKLAAKCPSYFIVPWRWQDPVI